MSDLENYCYEEDLEEGGFGEGSFIEAQHLLEENRFADDSYLKDCFDIDDEISDKEANAFSCLVLSIAFLIIRLLLPSETGRIIELFFSFGCFVALVCGVLSYININNKEKQLEEVEEY